MRFTHIIPEANTEGFRSATLANFNDTPEELLVNANPASAQSTHAEHYETAAQSAYPTEEELQQIHAKAHSEGHSEGYKEGFDSGFNDGAEKVQKELGSQALHMQQLINDLSGSLSSLDQQVEIEIAELATNIARQVLQRELKLHPEQILDAVRQGIALLPSSRRFLHLYLHHDDIAMVRNALEEETSDTNWKLIQDPSLSRGSCRLETDTSELQLDLNQRLTEVIDIALGNDDHNQANPP